MEAIPVGDDDDAAGWPSEALAVPDEQAPDAVPARPPPSKVDIKVGVPVLDVPVAIELPVMELPIEVPAVLAMEVAVLPPPMEAPVVALPVPVPVPEAALKVKRPKDACAIEPPKPEHATMLPFGASGDAPDTRRLVPRATSSVAPNGIPAGETGEAGPRPSGDVMPTAGVGLPPICANTGLLAKSVAAIATINGRLIIVSIRGRQRPRRAFAQSKMGNRPSCGLRDSAHFVSGLL